MVPNVSRNLMEVGTGVSLSPNVGVDKHNSASELTCISVGVIEKVHLMTVDMIDKSK